MNNKTGGIIATIASALFCGLPGIVACLGGIWFAAGAPGGGVNEQNFPILGVTMICVSLLLIAIPIAIGFLTLRRKTNAVTPYVMSAAVPPPTATLMPAPVYQQTPPPPPTAAPIAQPAPVTMDASSQTIYDRIMALNRPSAPYQIVDGRSQNVDLIAEWKIVDARWYEVFAKANLTKVFRIHMKLDPARREVRAMDQELTVSWRAGVPSLSFEASFFKGQKSSISFGTGYAFTENLAPGQVYKYKFNTNELKKPIQDAVAACSWTYKGIAFGKL